MFSLYSQLKSFTKIVSLSYHFSASSFVLSENANIDVVKALPSHWARLKRVYMYLAILVLEILPSAREGVCELKLIKAGFCDERFEDILDIGLEGATIKVRASSS